MEESEPLFQATPSRVDIPPQMLMRGGAIEGLQDEEGAPSEEEAPPPSNAILQRQLNTVFSVVGDMQRKMRERDEELGTARKENIWLMVELEEARLALASVKAEAVQASQRRQELQVRELTKIPDWKYALKFAKNSFPPSAIAEQLENIFESFERFSERHLKSASPAERASFFISGLEPFELLIEHVRSLTAEEKKDVALI
uniref:Uncharacterized protein n=1 Tax=Chromera velia CCMP2878 TaxID=1169474 RepID=A0A0G4HHJ1_9ALVE|eukprot:Cvel_27681.t1-p1 / transcript=Cvel_27681.t1 / gene=Cvel_27681 / organism=Chromera_velia_CCMP2878 / gene_product=hypothetical protein / transcript_product=hypothetical protein / location=Cvel_scaffold3492:6291-6890(-) / protein_length=200 / sequence_SO=supercontig / SO=protein_coding / is_pseudo=false